MNPEKRMCAYVAEGGRQCMAPPMRDSLYCFHHNPDIAQQRIEARKRGGLHSRRYVEMPDVNPPTTAREAKELMARVLAALVQGKIDPKIANATSIAVQTFIKTLDLDEVEAQINELTYRIQTLENISAA